MAAAPFSFQELFAQRESRQDDDSSTIQTTDTVVVASDGVELAVHIYEPSAASKKKNSNSNHNSNHNHSNTALVFYHGGGAHAGAGYQYLAGGLAERYAVTVYLPDLRGHGSSGGPRGDAPSKEQVWKDVDAVLEFVAETNNNNNNKNNGTNIFLGGHSSGGGLVVNYATEGRQRNRAAAAAAATTAGVAVVGVGVVPIGGYVLVSPELGYKSGTARPGRTDFAKVNVFAFLLNAIFGILGHSRAVRFRYPRELLDKDGGMVAFNTVHMANAITPETPREQMRAMCDSNGNSNDNTTATTTTTTIPVGLWIGSDDELFVAESVADFVKISKDDNNSSSISNTAEILPGKNHLGILVEIHEAIGQWITQDM